MKTFIAYDSRRGQNLVNGTVKSHRVGNTELAAAMIQKYTGAVCFRIEPYEDYPDDYYQCIDLARQDLRQGKRPKLKNCPECLDQYNMFQQIHYIAEKYSCKFSLYVDDMTFLSDSPIDFKLKEEIREELRAYGLTAKPEKDKYYRRGCPKSVTGMDCHTLIPSRMEWTISLRCFPQMKMKHLLLLLQ